MSRKASDSLLLLLETSETSISIQYRRISCTPRIVFRISFSTWPCSGFLGFESKRGNVKPVRTSGGLCCHAPWAKRRFWNRSVFSLLRSVTAVILSKPSPRPPLRLFLGREEAGGSWKSRRADLVSTRLFKRPESAGVIGEGLLSFLFTSVINLRWDRE